MSNGTVTIINTTPYNWQPVPEVGKEYHAFDDGKIKPSRLEVVKIMELIPFDKVDEELLKDWKQNVEECYWLYASETDYFAKGEYDDETSYFVRTEDDGWFSLGWFGSRLDIDGSLYEKMKEWYNVEE
jgi:hypothetical protein